MHRSALSRPLSRAVRILSLSTFAASLAVVPPALADTRSTTTARQATPAPQPFLSEVAPMSAADAPAWFEIAAPNARTSLGGWTLSDEDGHMFTLPRDLPTLPANGTLLVVLGTGQDDRDASDGTMKLHTQAMPADTFAPEGDQLALYHSPTPSIPALVDFVAWGVDPGTQATTAVRARKWLPYQYIYYDGGFGAGVAASPPVPNASLGRWSGAWVAYGSATSTPGRRNPPPTPMRSNVPDGTEFSPESVSVAWTTVDAAGMSYVFELSDTRDFARTLFRARTTEPMWKPMRPLPAGEYFWRVLMVDAAGNASQWTKPQGVKVLSADPNAPKVVKTLLKPEHFRVQRKDTTMLEIGGTSKNFVAATENTAAYYVGLPGLSSDTRNRWDGPHVVSANDPTPSYSGNGMDNWLCVRASTAMLNAYYGGSLSLDRISYYRFEEAASANFEGKGKPEFDLGYRTGIGSRAAQEDTIQWAIGAETVTEEFCSSVPSDDEFVCPFTNGETQITWEKIVDLIDSGRPFATTNYNNAHMRVVDGYRINHDGTRMVRKLDPVPTSGTAGPAGVPRWVTYDSFRNDVLRIYYLKAGETPAPKQHNSAISKDTDGDGVNDFDETMRFKTMPNYKDSDYDWLNDKQDIFSYVFYNKGYTYDYATPNADKDVYRKELDWDNDNDGAPDGCEDANADGFTDFNAGETSSFVNFQMRDCIPRMRVTYPAPNAQLDAGTYLKPKTVMVHLDMELPESLASEGTLPTFKNADFAVKVGDRKATVTTTQQLGDTARILFALPTQLHAGVYDLSVTYTNTFGSVTRTVAGAFRYQDLPITP